MAIDATHAYFAFSHDGNCDALDWQDDGESSPWAIPTTNRERRRANAPRRERVVGFAPAPARQGPTRAARNGAEAFKCRHCRAFVGPTISGGRHRNHCPLCLHSRHVDDRRPGDRASDCGATMAPVARFDRPNGEPVVVHHCLGCGVERHNRLAADDNTALLMGLSLGSRAPVGAREPIRSKQTGRSRDTPRGRGLFPVPRHLSRSCLALHASCSQALECAGFSSPLDRFARIRYTATATMRTKVLFGRTPGDVPRG